MDSFLCASCGQITTSSLGVLETNKNSRCNLCQGLLLLQNRYQLHSLLGQGATGSTYKCWDLQQEQWVALKEIPWRPGDDSKRKKRFLREATILSQLDHPQTPRYIDHFFIISS